MPREHIKQMDRQARTSDGLRLAKGFRDLPEYKQDRLLAKLDYPTRMTLLYWLAVTEPFQDARAA